MEIRSGLKVLQRLGAGEVDDEGDGDHDHSEEPRDPSSEGDVMAFQPVGGQQPSIEVGGDRGRRGVDAGIEGGHGRRQQSRDHEAGHSGRDVAEDEERVDLLRQQRPHFRSRIVFVEDVERRPDKAEEHPDGHGGDRAQHDPLAGFAGGLHGLVALNGHLIDAHVLRKVEQVHERRHPNGLFGEIQGGAAHRELAVGQRHSHHLAEAARHHPEDDGQADESAQDQGETPGSGRSR